MLLSTPFLIKYLHETAVQNRVATFR